MMVRRLLVAATAAMVATLTHSASLAADSRLDRILESGVIKAGIRRDNPPHSFIDSSGNWAGFDVDMAKAIAAQLGVDLEKVPVDELTRISYLQNGTIDIAAASMSHTWKRDEQVDFSQTYFWSNQTFLVRTDTVSSYQDLVGQHVGMSRGSHSIGNWRTWLRRNGYSVDDGVIVEFGNKQSAVQAVLQGAIYGWAEDAEVLASYAREHPELTVLHDDAIGVKQDGIGIPEDDSDLRDAVNHALQGIEKTGLYDELYHQWFGPDGETPVPLTHRIEVWPDG